MKKGKKTEKHTISVINLSKNGELKMKNSSTITKRKQSAADFSERLK